MLLGNHAVLPLLLAMPAPCGAARAARPAAEATAQVAVGKAGEQAALDERLSSAVMSRASDVAAVEAAIGPGAEVHAKDGMPRTSLHRAAIAASPM